MKVWLVFEHDTSGGSKRLLIIFKLPEKAKAFAEDRARHMVDHARIARQSQGFEVPKKSEPWGTWTDLDGVIFTYRWGCALPPLSGVLSVEAQDVIE